MNTQSCTCCANEDEKELLNRIAEMTKERAGKDSLIQLLHTAQAIYGYLPLEVQKIIADATGTPLAKVSGVLSFYSFFTVKKRGKHTIRICLGTACYVRGGKKLVDHIRKNFQLEMGDTTEDGLFSFEIVRCIGACGLAPAIMIDDVVYKQMTPEKLDALIKQYENEEAASHD